MSAAGAQAWARRDLLHHFRRTITLAWPVMLARAGLLVMALVDAAMIGRVSGPGLAHYGIAMAPFLFFLLVGTGLLIGTVVLVAQADGAGAPERAGVVWRLALVLALIVGTGFALLLWQGEALLELTRQPPELARDAGLVLRILGLGMVPMLLFVATSLMLEGLGKPRVGLVVMIGANLVNAGLNALVLWGPVDAVEGAAAEVAFATTATRWLMAIGVIAYTLLALDRRRFGLTGPLTDARAALRKLVRLGLPIAGANGLESFAFTTMSLLAGWLGTIEAAAYLICLNFSALVYMLALGLGTAASVRVGNAVGRGDGPNIATAGWVATALGLALTAVAAPLVLLFPDRIAALYTNDAMVVAHALPALMLVAFLLVVDAAQGILIGALRGAGDVRLPLAIQATAYVGVAVPLGYGLAFAAGHGIFGLITGLVAGLGTAAVLLAWRFREVSARGAGAL